MKSIYSWCESASVHSLVFRNFIYQVDTFHKVIHLLTNLEPGIMGCFYIEISDIDEYRRR